MGTLKDAEKRSASDRWGTLRAAVVSPRRRRPSGRRRPTRTTTSRCRCATCRASRSRRSRRRASNRSSESRAARRARCSPSRRWWPRRRRLAMPVDERCGGLTAVASRLERAHSREEIKVRLWFTSKLQMELCYCGDLWCSKNVTSIFHRYVHLNASILRLLQRTHVGWTVEGSADVQG